MTVDDIIDHVVGSEGGFVDNPHDRGGPTNFGITAADLGRWRKLGRIATAQEVQAMPESEARAIYTEWYVDKPGFGAIADGYLRYVVVDSGVLHGTGSAARWLQQALGVAVDGVIGQQTSEALAKADAALIARRVLAIRFKRYGTIVSKDNSQLVFLAGWLNRAADLLQTAA